eukprot:1195380-Prorocentrum_minimum.AAC.3
MALLRGCTGVSTRERKKKTAYTSMCRQGDALRALRVTLSAHAGVRRTEPTPGDAMPVGGKCAPHVPPSDSYQYLGVHAGEPGTELEERSVGDDPQEGCGGTTATQKIKLVEMVMRPAMRYSMAVVPCTWALSFAR